MKNYSTFKEKQKEKRDVMDTNENDLLDEYEENQKKKKMIIIKFQKNQTMKVLF
jgi:hypothetical protein